ncbi:MAG: hypothetical protein WA154_10090 [Moraxellaceae bacterium]
MSDLEQTVVDAPTDAPTDLTPTDTPDLPEPTPEEAEAKAKADAEEVERKKQDQIDRRIGKERAKRADAERKAQELEQELAKYQKPKTDAMPQIGDFQTYAEYEAALRDKVRNDAIAEYQTEQSQQQQAQSVRKAVDGFAAREQAAATELPDYFDVANKALPIIEEYGLDQEVYLELISGEHGALVSYELCSDVDALEDFLKLSKSAQLRKLGALEAKVAANPPKSKAAKVSNAPAPLKPVSANAPTRRDPSKMSDAEWFASRKK